MKRLLAVILLIGLGALCGAMALSVLTVLLYALFQAEELRGGEFGMVLMFTIPMFILPFGARLGGAIALAVHEKRKGRSARAGWLATVLWLAVLVFAAVAALASAESSAGGIGEFVRAALALWIVPCWTAAAALTYWGTRQLGAVGRGR